jgi:hypothetical protein
MFSVPTYTTSFDFCSCKIKSLFFIPTKNFLFLMDLYRFKIIYRHNITIKMNKNESLGDINKEKIVGMKTNNFILRGWKPKLTIEVETENIFTYINIT